MNNEIQRKITSLTLMTIMVAGSLTFAIPGVMPEVNAEVKQTANLSVSSTTFGGPMILEIIVTDNNLSDTDESEARPDVTFGSKDIVMVQATDGRWYAYVAHSGNVDGINGKTPDGIGLNFGTKCTGDERANILKGDNFDAAAVVYTNAQACKLPTEAGTGAMNVIKKSKTLTPEFGQSISLGQSGVNGTAVWPFIQGFDDFTDDATVKVTYNLGGSPQSIDVVYTESMDDYASYSLDRDTYPHNSHVHLKISDNQLNIDPTEEDVWTFNTNGSKAAYYDLFDNSGEYKLGDVKTPKDYSDEMDKVHYGDNGHLTIDTSPNSEKPLVRFVNNTDQKYHKESNIPDIGKNIVTVRETLPNSGVFENTDNSDMANMVTTDDSTVRGLDFIVEYNDSTTNKLIDYFTGSIEMDVSEIGSDWGSGEALPVTIVDQDINKNTRSDDDFDVSDDKFVAIPTIEFGKPFTLGEPVTVTVEGIGSTAEQEKIIADATSQRDIAATKRDANASEIQQIRQAKKAQEDILTANQTVWKNWKIANATAHANAFSQKADNVVLSQIQSKIDTVNAGRAQIQVKIDALYTDAQRAKIEAQDAVIKEIEAHDKTIDNAEKAKTSVQNGNTPVPVNYTVSQFDKVLRIDTGETETKQNAKLVITTGYDAAELNDIGSDPGVHMLINYDFRSLEVTDIKVKGKNGGELDLPDKQGLLLLTESNSKDLAGPLIIEATTALEKKKQENKFPVVFDVFKFGQDSSGKRYNDAIYRFEAEETTTNSGIYGGTVEYTMLNQINTFKTDTFSSLTTIGDELEIIVHEDLTDEDAVEMIYLDTDGQGKDTQVSAQTEAPTHSATVSFDADSYKVADTVTITVQDADLNTDSDTIEIYTTVNSDNDITGDTIALPKISKSKLLDVTFDDKPWKQCTVDGKTADGMFKSIKSLKETSKDSGIFTTTFQIPEEFCTKEDGKDVITSVTGKDLEVNYQDYRNESGEEIEVGDSAGVRANTGSVSFDRTVYPVPFGQPGGVNESFFPIHATGINANYNQLKTDPGRHLENGDLTIHVRVNDPDYDLSASGEDKIDEDTPNGPVKVMVTRGSQTVVLGTAGAEKVKDGLITIGKKPQNDTRDLGPIVEVKPDSGIFELDMTVKYTDGPSSTSCPTSNQSAVSHIQGDSTKHCILQGDILTVEYTDPTDASGDENTVTDSATFDLRNGVLQSDKSVYIIGSDMILTLIEPDFDLDNDQAETYTLDLIEWDSDAAAITMGKMGDSQGVFDPEPSDLRETGDSTGIFQVVIEIPSEIGTDALERGEEIELEYTDWGPSGADYVGDEDEDVNLTIYTSNFGATVELDQKVYTWTDKVYITIVAPDHNFDSDLIDEIGNTSKDPLKVSTRGHHLDEYKLVETGTDTGIFTGEVILTGFPHNADGDSSTGDANGNDIVTSEPAGSGPTNGKLPADDDDGLTVSFEFSEDDSVVGSALIRWNIGEVQWLEASYSASGTGVVRVIDPDMNLDPEAVDNFDVDVWSDSDAGGIDLTVTETNEATGIFEGTVFFTVADESSGHRLRVSEGDTVTAEYEDNTLPDPDTTADERDITATTLIGTVVPPLERAPATNLRVVDAFSNTLDSVTVDQQVQVTADLANGQDREQAFAYLVQVQDKNGVTVSLAWIKGSLSPDQSLTPALSWIPLTSGEYTATAFVWESVDNPTALSPPVTTTITVS